MTNKGETAQLLIPLDKVMLKTDATTGKTSPVLSRLPAVPASTLEEFKGAE